MARRALLRPLPRWSRLYFEAMVQKSDDPEGCWIWQGEMFGDYGDFNGVRAHRVAFFEATGIQPGKLNVCHTCNTPPCVNPDHLYLGTQKENIEQCVAEGRHHRTPGTPKLTDDQVREIRGNPQVPLSVYAERFTVSVPTIHKARIGKWYKHVT